MDNIETQPNGAAILTALTRYGPLSGPEIGKITRMHIMKLYPALARLEAVKAVTSDWVDGPYPRTRQYNLPNP